MLQLICMIMVISIMAIVFLGGNGITTNKLSEISIKNRILSDYMTLKQGNTIYKEHTDSYLPVSNWETELEKYVFLPKDILEFKWEYNNNENGYYFCLTGNTNDLVFYNALEKSGLNLNKKAFYINTECGSNTNFLETPIFNGIDSKVSATFFIK